MVVVTCTARSGHGVAAEALDGGAVGGASCGGGAPAAGRQALAGGSRAAPRCERRGRHVLEAAVGGPRAPGLASSLLPGPALPPERGPVAAGFDTERWTQRRIAAVVERTFGVRYHFRSLGRALRARGWSPQRPIPQARERDEALVAAWLKRDWPRIKRGLAAQGARLPSWTKRVTRFGPD